MTNWRNLGLDNMSSALLGNQNKINFYVFITSDNRITTAQLAGWKPTAATRCYYTSIDLNLSRSSSGLCMQYYQLWERCLQGLAGENKGTGNVSTGLVLVCMIRAIWGMVLWWSKKITVNYKKQLWMFSCWREEICRWTILFNWKSHASILNP